LVDWLVGWLVGWLIDNVFFAEWIVLPMQGVDQVSVCFIFANLHNFLQCSPYRFSADI